MVEETKKAVSAIKDVVSEVEAESIKLDKTVANLGVESALGRQFERLDRLGREAFGEMSVKAQQLAKDIQEDTLALSNLEKMQMALNDQYEAGKIPLDDYISAQARLSVLHEKISKDILKNEQALRSESATNEQASKSRKIAEDSMASMQRQVALLTTSYMNLSQAQRESTEGQQILKNLSDVQTRLQNASAAMSKYGGAANKQFNGLNFSIQQIAREMPTLAMGPQMFFTAISNNLPTFTDELASAREEYAQFKAEGKSATPVWKQMVSSIFSWQTALAAGITLLTAYGDEIMSWVSSLLKGREAVISTTKALKDMQNAADFDNAGQQIANFKRLADLYREIGDNAEEKRRFIEQYKEEIEKTGLSINNVNDADNAFVTNADAFVESVRKRAMAMAGMKLASEQFSKALEQQEKSEQNSAKTERLKAKVSEYKVLYENALKFYGEEGSQYMKEKYEKAQRDLEDFTGVTFMRAGEALIDTANNLFKQGENTLESAGMREKAAEAERIRAINEQYSQIATLMDRNAKEQARQKAELQHQIDQAVIDAMKDGHEKSMAQRELDNEIELETIRRQKKEYKQAVIDGEKEVFEAQEQLRAEQDKNYVKKIFYPNSVKVNTSMFDRLYSEILKKQLAEEQALLSDALRDYETYEQARLRIQEEYTEKRRVLINEDGSMREGVMQGNLDELARQEQEALESISVTFAMRDAAFEQWSKNLSRKTAEALDLMLSEAMEALSILENTEGADPSDIARATAAVVKLREALDNGEQSVSESSTGWTELNEVLKDSLDIFTELGKKIPGVAGEIISAFGRIGTSAVSVSNSFKALNDIRRQMKDVQRALDSEEAKFDPDTDKINELSDAMKKLGTEAVTSLTSAASGIASIVSSVVSGITDIINANKEANEAAARAAWEYAEALEAVQENARLDKYDTIFGENALGRFMEVVDLIKSNKQEIQDTLGNMTGASADDYYSLWDKDTNAVADKIAAMGNTSIVSDLRSKWQKFWGTGGKNISAINLADYINDDGTVKLKELQAWYEAWGDGLEDTEKQLIESFMQDGEQLNNYLEEEKQYISSLFGDLSGDIADSMLDAFEKTGNAAIDAGEVISDVAKNFAKSWIKNKLMEDIFNEEAQDKIFDLMDAGDTEGALDYLSELIGEANALAPQITEYLQGLDGLATEIEEPEQERTSTSKGIAQASQDSVDELNGRATVIQGHTYSISTDMKVLVSTSAMMLDRLAAIETNTARLEGIESGIAQMRADISYINTKGLFLRK